MTVKEFEEIKKLLKDISYHIKDVDRILKVLEVYGFEINGECNIKLIFNTDGE